MTDEGDASALQLSEDLSRLTGIWHSGGDAALLADVGADRAMTFAVRRLPEGAELLVMRAGPPPDDIAITYDSASTGYSYRPVYRAAPPRRSLLMTMGFLARDDGSRCVIARSESGMILMADGTLEDARIAPVDDPLAESLAGYLGLGIDRRLDLPPSVATWAVADEIGLLSVLDAAGRYLDGRLRLAAAVYAIAGHRASCGIGERDGDISEAYAIDCCLFGAAQYEYERDKRGGDWTVEQELAAAEGFHAGRGQALSKSLMARFRPQAIRPMAG